jgi:hypothetical protein
VGSGFQVSQDMGLSRESPCSSTDGQRYLTQAIFWGLFPTERIVQCVCVRVRVCVCVCVCVCVLPVILATQEAEIQRIQVPGQPGEKSWCQAIKSWEWCCVQVIPAIRPGCPGP